MIWILFGALIALIVGGYFLFRDTMNKIQYLERCRIYWVTRNVAKPGTPLVKKAWMREIEDPWHRGTGIEFRAGKYTFQVGYLTGKVNSLHEQISNRPDFDPSLEDIRRVQFGGKFEEPT